MQISPRFPRETGRDYAYRILKENIVTLELKPGSMVSENELSAALGLSRTPVREALQELAKVHIVEILPQKGSRIALIDPCLVEQSHFLRETLECVVVKQVCKMATEEDLEQLRNSIRAQELYKKTGALELVSGESVSFMALDNHFHEILYQIAGKEMIYQLVRETMIHFDRIRNLTIHYVTEENVIEQHKGILQAIEARDSYLAAALTHSHLSRFQDISSELRDQYPDYFKAEA